MLLSQELNGHVTSNIASNVTCNQTNDLLNSLVPSSSGGRFPIGRTPGKLPGKAGRSVPQDTPKRVVPSVFFLMKFDRFAFKLLQPLDQLRISARTFIGLRIDEVVFPPNTVATRCIVVAEASKRGYTGSRVACQD
jgi:hypothetical protein